MGNIGNRVAQIASSFGANVYYWSKSKKPQAIETNISYLPLEQLISECDIISLNLALNNETEEILNKKLIKNIKPNSIFINLSPMELVNFDSLYNRLLKNDLTLILDHSDEMTKDQLDKLLPLSNAIVYPPIAYLTDEATELKQQIFIDNIINFIDGTPTNKVN